MDKTHRSQVKAPAQQAVLILILLVFTLQLQPPHGVLSAPTATHTVNTNGDSPDGDLDDGVCDINLLTPAYECSLRAAIEQANAPNTGHDTILFSSSWIIAPASELPALTNINGATIYAAELVYLLGTNLSTSGDGLRLDSNHNNVMGLVIAGFDNGLIITGDDNRIGTDGDGNGDDTEGNVIYSNTGIAGFGIQISGSYNVVAGNTIGLLPNGSDTGPNTGGIWVSGSHNRIGTNGDRISDSSERNVISGNTNNGVQISGNDNEVSGNYIGTNATGDAARANGNHGIKVDPAVTNLVIGTDSDGTGDTAERNIVSGNGAAGIYTQGHAVTIAGNFIGLNAAGSATIPNAGYGVEVNTSAYDTLIGTDGDGNRDNLEGNTISGNTTGGVRITGSDIQIATIAGNKIGTNPTGTAALSNRGDGVYADGSTADLVIGTDGDGVGDASERNLISGNLLNGVHLGGSLAQAVVAGNFIGTSSDGTVAIANIQNGVLVDGGANDNLIGSDGDGSGDPQERNLISGNGGSGVRIEGAGSDSNKVTGNHIGTTASGVAILPNASGVWLDDQAEATLIGSYLNPDLGNIISGNTNEGIYIGFDCNSTQVWRNKIGTDTLRTISLGNGRNGLYLTAGAQDTVIQQNTIAHNTGAGIYLTPTAGNSNYYTANRIYANSGLGVDLAPVGVNPNDPGDIDSGPNDLMNYPVFTKLVTDGSEMLFEGTLNSEPDSSFEITAYTVEACDPTGYGEGGGAGTETNLSTISVDTDENGNGVFAFSFGGYSADRPYMVLSTGYSEFSECRLMENDHEAYMSQLSIADAQAIEGDAGSGWMDFYISLDHSASITVTVSYGLQTGTATSGEDFIAAGGQLIFPPGTTEQTLQVEILGDTELEANETFVVNLSAPVGAQIQDPQATGTILDDDGQVMNDLFLPLVIH